MLFNKDAMPSIFAWSKTSPGRKLPRKRSLPSDGPVAKKAWVDSDICNANTSQEGTTEDTSQASFGGHDYCVKATTASTEEQLEAAQLRIKELEEINSRLSSEKCNLVMSLAAKPDQAMRFYTGFPSFKIDSNISAVGSEAHSRKDDKLVTDAESVPEKAVPRRCKLPVWHNAELQAWRVQPAFSVFAKAQSWFIRFGAGWQISIYHHSEPEHYHMDKLSVLHFGKYAYLAIKGKNTRKHVYRFQRSLPLV